MGDDAALPVLCYGVAVCFLPGNPTEAMRLMEQCVEAEGQHVLGWRDVPVNEAACGVSARAVAPRIAPGSP